MTAPWIESAHSRDLLAVARQLGLATKEARGASGGSFGPCPACTAARRHPSRRDRRLACGVRPDGDGWRCFECDTSGDVIDLVALRLEGHRYRDLSDTGRERVREWFGAERPAPRVTRQIEEQSPVRAPSFPPQEEVRALWAACVSVLEVDGVRAYLAKRRVDAVAVHDRDLARALPSGAELPGWARIGGRAWSETGHALLLPLFDAHGQMRSVLARRVTDAADELPKSIAPAGHTRAGLVLADALARRFLESGTAPAWLTKRTLWIAEGEIDFLVFATKDSDAADGARATVGITSGSWKHEHAMRLDEGVRVVIATDHDDAGEKYCAAIVATFAGTRHSIDRWAPLTEAAA